MNNLIVTIIAIAITAAVAGSALWYGGQAYQQYQVNLYAAKTIATMNQIKSAVYAWQQDNPGQSFPLKDPVTGTTYASSNATAWGDTLTYKGKQYLSLPFYTCCAYNSFNINYGLHGNLLDWASTSALSGTAHFWGANIRIQPDTAGNMWLVWSLDMSGSFGVGSYGPSDVLFYGQVCYAINQQMGQIPYASNLTINTNYYYYVAPAIKINLPYYNNYGISSWLSNICTISNNNNAVKNYYFAMPL